ncbi:NAD(P)-dependent dehydrogenase (short-subunit alcohol dehydrogenase family) [Kribbella aluminosa]|uniref:NAD(P)-dependent dehydrogenase (Short-subunit alcohol dehydrogenase family) n=1 Tax=Kribbella aluminosa TaxID=416017 RepID=A0ABS4UIJ7_9ACTN|nr:SDR family NAD(P)-dependent oxidoreductase [Kribbella aluminosa]MBP2351433.1 NAD(P)-dependent dehydrogenase (short-subunit alcohol dehydrogenase family) [Kribbella aluminosa]
MFDNFDGSGAVVTGAAHGIGRALAFALAREGCAVVLADLDRDGLVATEAALAAVGAKTFTCITDVADAAAVDGLADFAFDRLGAVQILCNNAGIVGPTGNPVWEIDVDEWSRVFGVNVMGVLNGLRSFLPRMQQLGEPCHVVNTASECGWVPSASVPQYFASKHAVVSLTESLRLQAAEQYPWLTTTLLCPRLVDTGITERERTRIEAAGKATGAAYTTDQAVVASLPKQSPAFVADCTIDAMRAGKFHVFPDPESKQTLMGEFDEVLASI